MIKRVISPSYSTIKDLNHLVESIRPKHSCSSIIFHRHVYDTHDWRIFNAGYLFEHDLINKSHRLTLQPFSSQNNIMQLSISSVPRFCQEIKSGPMKSKLAEIVKARAFILKNSFYVNRFDYDITNDVGKINLRLTIEGLYIKKPFNQDNCITCYMILRPLRGYEKQFKKVERLLKSEFGFSELKLGNVISNIKNHNNISEYLSPKFNIDLEKEMASKIALASILLKNLDTMEKNENGILNDIDIEFLHDFRIAGRRSRSFLGQLDGVFPQTRITPYDNDLKWLSKLSSTCRDLDVFLWDFNNYVTKVSSNGEEILEPLRQLLIKQRKIKHKKLVNTLNTKRYKKFKENWRLFLERAKNTQLNTPYEKPSVSDFASNRIWRCYRKILRKGNRIMKNYNYESIHTLRKRCKELRYLMDSFKSLYPDTEIKGLIKSLKILQDNLGEITDMHTQRDMVHNWNLILASNENINHHTIDAISEIEIQFQEREKIAQKKFIQTFNKFSSKSNKQLIKELFH